MGASSQSSVKINLFQLKYTTAVPHFLNPKRIVPSQACAFKSHLSISLIVSDSCVGGEARLGECG